MGYDKVVSPVVSAQPAQLYQPHEKSPQANQYKFRCSGRLITGDEKTCATNKLHLFFADTDIVFLLPYRAGAPLAMNMLLFRQSTPILIVHSVCILRHRTYTPPDP